MEVPQHQTKIDTSPFSVQTSLQDQQPLMKILTEYEGVNKELTSLLDVYEREHGPLRAQCTTLVEENNKLAEELKQLQSALYANSDEELIANLKQQLLLVSQEKDAALNLWKLAVGEVSNLEKILKVFQDQREQGYGSTHNVQARLESARALSAAESQLVEARAQLARERLLRAELESSMTREREARVSAGQQLEAMTSQLQHAKEEHALLLKSQQLDTEQLVTLARTREDLQRALEQNQMRLQQTSLQAEEGRLKVAEALTLLDSVTIARDQLAAGEAKAKEEVLRLQDALKELTEEAGNRVRREVEQLKQQCNARIQTLLVDMKKIQEECAEHKSMSERCMRDQKLAEECLERVKQELRTSQARQEPVYESKLSVLHRQLAEFERRAHAADSAVEGLQQQLAEERERSRRTDGSIEKSKMGLEQQVSALVLELKETQRRAGEATKEMGLRERQLLSRLEATEKNSVLSVTELHRIVAAHQNISEKCQLEMRAMAERFGTRMKELHGEVTRLRRERDEAHQELRVLRSQVVHLTPRHGGVQTGEKARPKSLFLDC